MGNSKRLRTILIASIILFSALGFFLTRSAFADMVQNMEMQIGKIYNVARLAQMYYVEDVDWDEAVEGAITGMLEKLDPHSIYIPSKKVKENKESFSGKYEGIGIQFDVIDDYLTVISPIPGTPSYKAGIRSGDRIIKINGVSAIGIANEDVPKKLKGPKGTSVDITISRDAVEEPLEFTIVRDVIPLSTITASFMADDSTGYIFVNRFAAITAKEVEENLTKLEKQGMKRLILDLRWNSGGYLHEAVKLAGKFLKGHKLVVYTKGRSQRIDEEYFSDQFGRRNVRSYPLIVLINRGSASASEIVAGAIQDFDRGLIVGENSFGKGLVQKEFPLKDGSAVRVTTAKYYTPSGRCIQRDYKGKTPEQYYDDVPDSSWITPDSLNNRQLHYTEKGRIVYGGGGIQPDFFVANTEYSKSPKLTNEILQKRLFFEFANTYAQKHPELKTSLHQFRNEFHIGSNELRSFKRLVTQKDIEFEDEDFVKDIDFIITRLKGEIARKFWDNDGYYYILLTHDLQFQKALSLFEEAKRMAVLD